MGTFLSKWNCVLLLVVAACATNQSAQAEWTVEPVDTEGNSGWSLHIDVDSQGTAHAAYFTTNPNGDYKYRARHNDGWQQETIFDNGKAFAIDDNDQRFFINVESPNFYPQFNILLNNGLTFSQQLATNRISSQVFLDFDQSNYPQIGMVNTTSQQLKHFAWDGDSWNSRTVASGPEFRFGNSSFVATLDDQDQMHFAWQNDADQLVYAQPTATSWQTSIPFPSRDARPYGIDVDSAGDLHLAYNLSTSNVSTGGLHYSLYDGTTWDAGRIPDLLGFHTGRSKIVADDSGTPHIFSYDGAFRGPTLLKHIYMEDGAWTNETIDSFSDSSSGPDEIEVTREGDSYHILYSTGDQEIYYAFQDLGAAPSADQDSDGDVDGADFLLIQRNDPAMMSQWQASYSTLNSLQSQANAVPEPSAILLLTSGLLISIGKRRMS